MTQARPQYFVTTHAGASANVHTAAYAPAGDDGACEGRIMMRVRGLLLVAVDLIERELGIAPRTAEIRQAHKCRCRSVDNEI